MRHPPDRERTGLLAILTGALMIGVAVLVLMRGRALLPVVALVPLCGVWLGLTALLRVRKDLGFEGRLVDFWSITHFWAGVMAGLVDVGFLWLLPLALLWEVIEVVCRVTEYRANRAIDVLLALVGWVLANLVAGGSLPLG